MGLPVILFRPLLLFPLPCCRNCRQGSKESLAHRHRLPPALPRAPPLRPPHLWPAGVCTVITAFDWPPLQFSENWDVCNVFCVLLLCSRAIFSAGLWFWLWPFLYSLVTNWLWGFWVEGSCFSMIDVDSTVRGFRCYIGSLCVVVSCCVPSEHPAAVEQWHHVWRFAAFGGWSWDKFWIGSHSLPSDHLSWSFMMEGDITR